jgi:formylglycine-generating enzyme required for sulfatase activity
VYEKPAGANWKNPGRLKQDDRHPVVGVNWDDAMAFCAWLTERERAAGRLPRGYVYTLPTEAEWEYACRTGSDGPEPANPTEFAWHLGVSGKNTQPVGTKQANAWGLHDMIGNVWEWCLDWYGPYPGGEVTDFQGQRADPPLPRFPAIHNNRGNGFNGEPGHATSSTNRWDRAGQDERDTLGFRVALRVAPSR